MLKNLLKIASTLILPLVFATAVHAATSIRLEQPHSPTNQDSFNVNFVTLDTDNNSLTVQCFKKGPSDGGFSQFGSDIVITPNGGNTGDCAVNSSIINASGTYQFYATANNGSTTATSNTVTVNFNNSSGPGTPTNYSKEKPSDCVYRIKFKTADDSGKTVKVEVYRSENTSFNADSGTRVAIVSIGSNTDGSVDVTSPDCSKTYYFAVRAFDSFGNGSSAVGDSITTVTTTTTTPAAPASPTVGGAITVASSQVSQTGGSVLGEKTRQPQEGQVEATQESNLTTPSPKASPSPKGQPGAGLLSGPNLAIGAAVILVLLVLGFLLFRPKPPQPPQQTIPPQQGL